MRTEIETAFRVLLVIPVTLKRERDAAFQCPFCFESLLGIVQEGLSLVK